MGVRDIFRSNAHGLRWLRRDRSHRKPVLQVWIRRLRHPGADDSTIQSLLNAQHRSRNNALEAKSETIRAPCRTNHGDWREKSAGPSPPKPG